MLDTVKLRSPYLSEEVAAAVECQMVRTERTNLRTGEVMRSLTGNSLQGSYDHRVQVRVERTELRTDHTVARIMCQAGKDRRRKIPVPLPSPPYVVIEGSVHKALLGHNIKGGPLDPVAACRWLVAYVSKQLGVDLPEGSQWEVMRLDWAEVYDLGTFEGVDEFIHCLHHARMPRRRPGHYDGALNVPGHTTTVKLYSKGMEFAQHDSKRLRWLVPCDKLEELQLAANQLLRVEVEVKLRKIRAAYQAQKVTVAEVTQAWLEEIHDEEVRRLLKEGLSDMETIRTTQAVEQRLRDVYGGQLARNLMLTWMRFATYGEQEARKTMERATYFRHKKQLTEAGCSWHASDLKIVPQLTMIPAGFSPVRSDPRRLVAEDPAVVAQLEAYRTAA